MQWFLFNHHKWWMRDLAEQLGTLSYNKLRKTYIRRLLWFTADQLQERCLSWYTTWGLGKSSVRWTYNMKTPSCIEWPWSQQECRLMKDRRVSSSFIHLLQELELRLGPSSIRQVKIPELIWSSIKQRNVCFPQHLQVLNYKHCMTATTSVRICFTYPVLDHSPSASRFQWTCIQRRSSWTCKANVEKGKFY